jgi:S1-C subfamily serine protease
MSFLAKVISSWIVLLVFPAAVLAQDLKISDLPQPMESTQHTSDLTGIAIPRKLSIPPSSHIEQIRSVVDDLSQESVLRGAGSDLFRRLVDGVVLIYVEDGSGAGGIIDKSGLVITNWHVIAGQKTAGVVLRNKGVGVKKVRTFIGRVIKQNKKNDLALLKIDGMPFDVTVLPLGQISEIEVGAKVHAIGHPDGQNWTYTTGAVGQIRTDYTWSYDESFEHKATVIQSQTPINPGNSGGPLFSNRGNIVGINSFGNNETEGINFAVSVDNIRSLISGEEPKQRRNPVLPEPLSHYATEQWDRSGNNTPDAFGFDEDRNGKIELYAEDEDEDDKAEIWFLDFNENKVKDGVVVAASVYYDDVPGDIWLFDRNEDEEFEMIGFDYNSDGQIDEVSLE